MSDLGNPDILADQLGPRGQSTLSKKYCPKCDRELYTSGNLGYWCECGYRNTVAMAADGLVNAMTGYGLDLLF